jgi:16S rRNA (cytosine1402-N4)-methyltransferase
MGSVHQPVLLHQTIAGLALREGHTAIDATAGGGGHAKAIAEAIGASGVLLAIDRDADNLERAKEALSGVKADTRFAVGNFRDIASLALAAGIREAHGILFDLGYSSDTLISGRGFSFQRDEPLLMTYEADPAPGALTAMDIVNRWSEEALADLIYAYGDERQSRRIAKAIVEARRAEKILMSGALARIIEKAVHRRGKTHPATRTFQALRIGVNDELGSIAAALPKALDILAAGGRLAVISFHSGEAALVKQLFKEWETAGKGSVATKRPVRPERAEEVRNPRSRSASLRIFQKSLVPSP